MADQKKENTQTERISPDEIAFQRTLLSEQDRLNAALDVWGRHLMQKYKLTQSDGIAPDGTIVRNAADNPSSANTE